MKWTSSSLLSITFLGVAAILLATGLIYYPKWKKGGTEATLSWDVCGYYYYLPATFIYKDLKKQEFSEQIHQKYHPSGQAEQGIGLDNGNIVLKYPAGMAVQWLPAFLLAHQIAPNLGYKADGFSRPYQLAISLHSLVISLIGIYFLLRFLSLYFPPIAAAGSTLLMTIGTNYLNYAAIDGALTHNSLFTIFVGLLWLSHLFYKSPSLGKALLIGLLIGLAALTRPTEIICALIPLGWGIDSPSAWKGRIQFWKTHWKLMLAAVLVTGLVGSIQLIYWTYATGSPIFYSYGEQGFSWLSPHLINGLLSYKAGWWIYSPLTFLAMLGFWRLYHYNKTLFWMPLVFVFLSMYIVFAWDIWDYGGSLGQRALIQSYPLLCFPMAALLTYMRTRGSFVQIGFGLLLALLLYLNLWFTHQVHRGGLIPTGRVTKAYFWATLGRNSVSPNVKKLLDAKEIEESPDEDYSWYYSNSFDETATGEIILDKETQASPNFHIPPPPKEARWLRFKADFIQVEREYNFWLNTQFIVQFRAQETVIDQRYLRIPRFLSPGVRKAVSLEARAPNDSFDHIRVLFWNASSEKVIQIDNLRVGWKD